MPVTTPMPRSAIPLCWLASGGLGSCVMEWRRRTCRNMSLLKSGPLSVRTRATDRTVPAAVDVPWRTTVRRKSSKMLGTCMMDFRRRIHFILVASSTMRRKYHAPPVVATGCLPLRSIINRSRYILDLVLAVDGCGSARWVPAGRMLHLSINLTYLRSCRCCLDGESANAFKRTSGDG